MVVYVVVITNNWFFFLLIMANLLVLTAFAKIILFEFGRKKNLEKFSLERRRRKIESLEKRSFKDYKFYT